MEERRFSAALVANAERALAPACEEPAIHTHNLCFLGFGNVNRTLIRLLENRSQELRDQHGISYRITGIASRRLGWIANPNGIETTAALALASDREGHGFRSEPALSERSESKGAEKAAGKDGLQSPGSAPAAANIAEWLAAARSDILFEATSLNVETGQPAVDHIRAAIDHGAHAITANKGPIVHAFRELRDLAKTRGKKFLFESTVMDGVPIFSLFDQLPAIRLQGFHGILNSTTNVILSEMEKGLTLDAALKKAQDLGVAETDATHDIDGWDAAIKTAALITVLMGSDKNKMPIRLEEIQREGIRDLTPEGVRNARRDGWPYKLVCRAKREGVGAQAKITASVKPEKILSSTPMAKITGTSSYIYFETDIFPGLAITEENPGLYATAYGMLADFVRAVS